jgi:hypothetical protein
MSAMRGLTDSQRMHRHFSVWTRSGRDDQMIAIAHRIAASCRPLELGALSCCKRVKAPLSGDALEGVHAALFKAHSGAESEVLDCT